MEAGTRTLIQQTIRNLIAILKGDQPKKAAAAPPAKPKPAPRELTDVEQVQRDFARIRGRFDPDQAQRDNQQLRQAVDLINETRR